MKIDAWVGNIGRMFVVHIKLTQYSFLGLAILLFLLLAMVSCYPLVNNNSIIDPESRSGRPVEAVSITIDLTTIAQIKSRKFIPKRSGQYVIRYIFSYKDKTKVQAGYSMPQSLTATIEILDDEGNILINKLLENSGDGYSGLEINLFDTSKTGKNNLLILRVSNLKVNEEDIEYTSEIKFSLFRRSNYLWGW